MKKIVISMISIILIYMICMPITFASSKYNIELKVNNNTQEKEYKLYILLPTRYINHLISEAGLNMEYEDIDTLKDNYIPGIETDKFNIQNETYYENTVEYIQILLDEQEKDKYIFSIVDNYPYMDMKFRISSDDRDNIIHLDNFKVENNKCEIEYNYDENTVKQPNKIKIDFLIIVLIIVVIIVVIVGIISKIKTKE